MSEGCKDCEKKRRRYSSPSGAVDAARIQTAETTEVRSWTSLPLIDTAYIPDDLDLIGGSNKEYKAWRIPANYFLPGGALNNTQYKVPASVKIENRQVTPVYLVGNSVSPVVPAKAKVGETATDIAVTSEDGTTVLMKNGYFTFDRPHMYEVGKVYYLSQDKEGEVVSVRPSAGIIQPLFSVVDQLTISINVQMY